MAVALYHSICERGWGVWKCVPGQVPIRSLFATPARCYPTGSVNLWKSLGLLALRETSVGIMHVWAGGCVQGLPVKRFADSVSKSSLCPAGSSMVTQGLPRTICALIV